MSFLFLLGAAFCVALCVCAVMVIEGRSGRAELVKIGEVDNRSITAYETRLRQARARLAQVEAAREASRHPEFAAIVRLNWPHAREWSDTSSDFIYDADGSLQRH